MFRSATFALATMLLVGSLVRAEISRIDTFRVIGYTQTANGASLALQGAFLTTAVITTTDDEFTAFDLSYPGPGSPVLVDKVSSTIYRYFSPFLATPADVESDYPIGLYTYDGIGGVAGAQATVDYNGTFFSDTLPYLEGDNYSALQGMNSALSFNFALSPFQPNDESSEAFIFLSVADLTTGTVVFEQNFLPSDTTTITMPAGTLLNSNTYRYRLVYSGRVNAEGSGSLFAPLNAFDIYAEGTFRTAVPEGSSMLLVGLGIVAGWAGFSRSRS
ncbi:PEP-CTERM sorting domain-containing protein [bacterium]|nr:PEP-CTERM sorting domain-containing protein [bacterium]